MRASEHIEIILAAWIYVEHTCSHIGLDKTTIDSILYVADGYKLNARISKAQSFLSFTYQKKSLKFDYKSITSLENLQKPVRRLIRFKTNLLYKHEEMFSGICHDPYTCSYYWFQLRGPALIVGDINHDGLEDVSNRASKWILAIFLQHPSGKRFPKTSRPDSEKDSTYENVDACLLIF